MTTPEDRSLDPASIASASFSHSRRGFDPNEVRAFLQRLSAHVQAVNDRDVALRRELDDLKAQPSRGGALDEATVAAWLGEEAARVLTTAREAAAQVRARAQEEADAAVDEARAEADRLRDEAALEAARQREDVAAEVARRRQESLAEAEAEIETARQEGRSMVGEARAVRERMLADLSRRRDGARTQLATLRGERDRIVNAIEATRDHLDRLMDDLRAATPDDERELPSYEQDLRSVTGEPRLTLVRPLHPVHQQRETGHPSTGEPGAAEAAPGATEAQPGSTIEVGGEQTGPIIVLGDAAPEGTAPVADDAVEPVGPAEEASPEAVEGAADEVAPEPAADDTVSAALGEPQTVDGEPTSAEITAEIPAVEPGGGSEETTAIDPAKGSVDDLFARIRAARSDVVGAAPATAGGEAAEPGERVESLADESDEPEPDEPSDPDEAAIRVRDEAIGPYQTALGRSLKRALADEQNEVFDRLRRLTRVASYAEVLGDTNGHAERYRAAGEDAVWGAALAGARSIIVEPADGALEAALEQHRVLDEVLDELSLDVALPERDRLETALSLAGTDPDEATTLLRNAYREWKAQRLDELATDLVLSAYGRGAFAAVEPGQPIRWVTARSWPPCAGDAVNTDAGAIAGGEVFPTGHRHAPAHAGCRCLIQPTHG
jgi:DivIVA domain-containing protein